MFESIDTEQNRNKTNSNFVDWCVCVCLYLCDNSSIIGHFNMSASYFFFSIADVSGTHMQCVPLHVGAPLLGTKRF